VTQLADHGAAPGFLTLPSATVAVLDTGDTGPGRATGGTARLVPGYTGSKEDFAAILDRLAGSGFRAVAMDQPGQYQSPGPDDQDWYSVARLGSVVNEVADALDGGPVHLLGHSFGGLVARAAVLARPDRYRSLILLCSGPAAIDGGRRQRMERLEPVAAHGMAAVYAAIQREAAADPAMAQPTGALAGFLRERFLASSPAGLLGMGHALRDEPDLVAELRETKVPALVCYGETDDAWGPAAQREMAARLGAGIAVIEGAGHSPAADQPARTAAALSAFWSAR
jgi:pimeloyl-ACP methyl ester carboxylesterase